MLGLALALGLGVRVRVRSGVRVTSLDGAKVRGWGCVLNWLSPDMAAGGVEDALLAW